MKISFSSVLLFALATESAVASSWFGGATKAGRYSFHLCRFDYHYLFGTTTLGVGASAPSISNLSIHISLHMNAYLLTSYTDPVV